MARLFATFCNVILNKTFAFWGIFFATLRARKTVILEDLVNAKLQLLTGTEETSSLKIGNKLNGGSRSVRKSGLGSNLTIFGILSGAVENVLGVPTTDFGKILATVSAHNPIQFIVFRQLAGINVLADQSRRGLGNLAR